MKLLELFKNNIKIILTSLIITLWFKGVGLIINHFVPDGNRLSIGLIMCAISAFILLMDDGKLNEIYRDKLSSKNVGPIITSTDSLKTAYHMSKDKRATED